MDSISNILSLLRPYEQGLAALDASGEWSFELLGKDGIKLAIVQKGDCWIITDDNHSPVHLNESDCFIINGHRRFIVTSNPQLTPMSSNNIMNDIYLDKIAVYNGGGEVFISSGCFLFCGNYISAILETLPTLIYLSKDSNQSKYIDPLFTWIINELSNEQLGGRLATINLFQLILLQVFRNSLEITHSPQKRWGLSLNDKKLAPAIQAIHANPTHQWRLSELANLSNMSRTSFSQRFKSVIKMTTMEYITLNRMLIAAERLENSSDNVSSIAFSLGYKSESAFMIAFKRVMRFTPTQYRKTFSKNE